MGSFRLSRELVAGLLGLQDECGLEDETARSSIEVRMDQMFREALLDVPNVVLIHSDDMDKLRCFPGWSSKKACQDLVSELKFTGEEGVNDTIMARLNAAPYSMARLLAGDRLVFCHSPFLSWARSRKTYTVRIALKALICPELKESRRAATPDSKLLEHDPNLAQASD